MNTRHVLVPRAPVFITDKTLGRNMDGSRVPPKHQNSDSGAVTTGNSRLNKKQFQDNFTINITFQNQAEKTKNRPVSDKVEDTNPTPSNGPPMGKEAKPSKFKFIHAPLSGPPQRRKRRKTANIPGTGKIWRIRNDRHHDDATVKTSSGDHETDERRRSLAIQRQRSMIPVELRPQSCIGHESALNALLDYYLNVLSFVQYPLTPLLHYNPIRAEWFPIAVSDDLLCATLMLSSAAQRSHVDPSLHFDFYRRLEGRVLNLLRQRLAGPGPHSDTTIGSVACLAATRTLKGDHEGWKLHMQGLAEMVRQRGGIGLIPESTRWKLCRTDLEGALDASSSPHFTAPDHGWPGFTEGLWEPHTVTSGEYQTTMKDSLVDLGVQPMVADALAELAKLSEALQAASMESSWKLAPRSYHQAMFSVQHALLAMGPLSDTISECSRLGALIYVKGISFGTASLSRRLHRIVRRLQQRMAQLPLDVWGQPLGAWILLLVGVASTKGERQEIFSSSFNKCEAFRQGAASWEEVKKSLLKLPWVDVVFDAACREFWESLRLTTVFQEKLLFDLALGKPGFHPKVEAAPWLCNDHPTVRCEPLDLHTDLVQPFRQKSTSELSYQSKLAFQAHCQELHFHDTPMP